MQNLGVIKQKVNFGIGYNALGLALAGSIAINAFIKLDNWRNKKKDQELLKESLEAIDTISECLDKLEKMETKSEENVEEVVEPKEQEDLA